MKTRADGAGPARLSVADGEGRVEPVTERRLQSKSVPELWGYTATCSGSCGGAPGDILAPTVASVAPASGATGVARNTAVVVRSRKAVVGVGSDSVLLVDETAGAVIGATASYSRKTHVRRLGRPGSYPPGTSSP